MSGTLTRVSGKCIWVIPPGWGTICDGVNCYIHKCTIYYPWLWLLINIVVISDWGWRDWFHSNLKNNCECALLIKDNRWYIYGCNNWHCHILISICHTWYTVAIPCDSGKALPKEPSQKWNTYTHLIMNVYGICVLFVLLLFFFSLSGSGLHVNRVQSSLPGKAKRAP